MALFKIAKGLAKDLPATKKEGNCWLTTDDQKFYIDISNSERICINNIPTQLSQLLEDDNHKLITSEYLSKLAGIASGAEVNVQSDWSVTDTSSDAFIANKPTLGTAAAKNVGTANGVAELDSSGKVPSSQLPSYVDDVVECTDSSEFPITGESGKIYINQENNKTYRWSGTDYVEISASLALGETSSTAYRGDRGKTAYDHATDSNRLTTAKDAALYKIATTAEGHVKSVTAAQKSDITALGIPGQDTTYTANTTSIGSASAWSAGTVPTLGDAISADDITAWSAGTVPSMSVSEGGLILDPGTLPSLSYTSKSIPNVTNVGTTPSLTITSTTVATGITAN